MDERDGFYFYRSFRDALYQIPAKDQLPVLKAIIDFGIDGKEPENLTPTQNALYLLSRPTLAKGRNKAANGKKGGSKQKANGKQNGSKKECATDLPLSDKGQGSNPNGLRQGLSDKGQENYCDDGDGESAREEASDSDLFRIGLRAGEYPGIDVGVVSAVEQKAEYLTTRYANRTCSPVDCRNVFMRSFWWDNGKYAFDKDAFGLLEYAFEQAEISGFSGQWRYINGILDRLSARDIHTRAEAEAFDEERPDKGGGSNGASY